MAGSRRAKQSWGMLLLTVLSIVASKHLARGQTIITDKTFAIVSVQCFAFAGSTLQNNYGLWWMQQNGLSSLMFNAVDVATTEIDCHFVSLANGAHQWFPVYKASGLPVACGMKCEWTIQDLGFVIYDPVANHDVQLHPWLAAPDNWIEPRVHLPDYDRRHLSTPRSWIAGGKEILFVRGPVPLLFTANASEFEMVRFPAVYTAKGSVLTKRDLAKGNLNYIWP